LLKPAAKPKTSHSRKQKFLQSANDSSVEKVLADSQGLGLWKFQKKFVEDPSRFIAAMWARGNGKSSMAGLKIVLDVLGNEAKGTPSNWIIVSANREQAKEALERVAEWAKFIYAIATDLEIIPEECELKTKEGKERYTRYVLRLGEHTEIMAMSASPRAVRGYTANGWWDEACFFDEDHAMWKAIQHCTRGRLKIIVTSTPEGGDEKKFHQIMHDETIVRGKPLWSKHYCDILQAIADGRPYDLEMEQAAADADDWAQEMMLEWIDNKSTWFNITLLKSCEDARASSVGHGYEGGKCYLGNDIGLRGDKWVAWVLEDVSGTFVTREVVVLDKSKFKDHDREIAKLFEKYNIVRMCIDQGGMGERSTEHYQDLYGGSRVEGLLFNVENKGAMAVLGRDLLDDRLLLLPSNQPEITRDLRRLQKITSVAGSVRFNAARDKHGHADRCWAMLMACNAAWTPVCPIECQSDNSEREATVQAMAGWAEDIESPYAGRGNLRGYW
jgi:phage FluMu gp28-like protein